MRIVRHQNAAVHKVHKVPHGLLLAGGILHHIVCDAGELCNIFRNMHTGVGKAVITFANFAVFHHHCANFCNGAVLWGKACGFQIEHHKRALHGHILIAVYHRHHIIYKVGLTAVDQLEIRVFFMNIIHGKHGLREALHHAVVGNGNGTVPHAVCHFHSRRRVAEAVHAAELRVQMKLNALFPFGVVCALFACRFQNIIRHNDIVAFKAVVLTAPADHKGVAFFQFIQPVAVFILLQPQFHIDRAGVIGDGNGIDFVIIPLQLCGKHITPHGHLACILPHLLQRGGFVRLEHMPIHHLCGHVFQSEARHLQGGKLFFGLKHFDRRFFHHFLFQFLCINRLCAGKMHVGCAPRRLCNFFRQLFVKLYLPQNRLAIAQREQDIIPFQAGRGAIKKTVDGYTFLLQLLHKVQHSLRRKRFIWKQASHTKREALK